MSQNAYPARTTVPEEVTHRARILGANGSVTQQYGPGMTITRTGEGAYLITWANSPGTFVGWSAPGFGAATPADLKGYTAVRDTYDSTAYTLAFVVYDSSFAAADLIADQYADLAVTFKTTAV